MTNNNFMDLTMRKFLNVLVIIASVTVVLISLGPSEVQGEATSENDKQPQEPQADDLEFDSLLEDDDDTVVRYQVSQENDHACPYFYNARFPDVEDGLANCTWYTSKSCCKRTEVTSVFAQMDPLYGASQLCRNYINYLMCFFCSPDQYKFYKIRERKLTVCHEYCEALHDECKVAGFNKTLIGDAYTNGTAFCEAQNFEVVEGADCFKFDPTVFGGCVKQQPFWWMVIFGFLLSLSRNIVFFL